MTSYSFFSVASVSLKALERFSCQGCYCSHAFPGSFSVNSKKGPTGKVTVRPGRQAAGGILSSSGRRQHRWSGPLSQVSSVFLCLLRSAPPLTESDCVLCQELHLHRLISSSQQFQEAGRLLSCFTDKETAACRH